MYSNFNSENAQKQSILKKELSEETEVLKEETNQSNSTANSIMILGLVLVVIILIIICIIIKRFKCNKKNKENKEMTINIIQIIKKLLEELILADKANEYKKKPFYDEILNKYQESVEQIKKIIDQNELLEYDQKQVIRFNSTIAVNVLQKELYIFNPLVIGFTSDKEKLPLYFIPLCVIKHIALLPTGSNSIQLFSSIIDSINQSEVIQFMEEIILNIET